MTTTQKRVRDVAVLLRMTASEKATFRIAAEKDGRSFQDWARRAMMRVAANEGVATEKKARMT